MNIPVFPETKVALKGKKGLIVGIANEHSIAWGCAKAFRAFGAEVGEVRPPVPLGWVHGA